MTEKQFIFDRDTVATNIKTPIVYDNEEMTIGEVLNKLNELYDENELLKEENRSLYVDIDFLTRFIEKRGFKIKRNLKEVLELMK